MSIKYCNLQFIQVFSLIVVSHFMVCEHLMPPNLRIGRHFLFSKITEMAGGILENNCKKYSTRAAFEKWAVPQLIGKRGWNFLYNHLPH